MHHSRKTTFLLLLAITSMLLFGLGSDGSSGCGSAATEETCDGRLEFIYRTNSQIDYIDITINGSYAGTIRNYDDVVSRNVGEGSASYVATYYSGGNQVATASDTVNVECGGLGIRLLTPPGFD